jgi:hypothetical protein
MSNEEHKKPNENANALGSALRDLGQQLIPRVQEFERTFREQMVAAKPYLANLVKMLRPFRLAPPTFSESWLAGAGSSLPGSLQWPFSNWLKNTARMDE